MRKIIIGALLAICTTVSAQQLAFPEAQGWGRYATGGRTGSVYHVTNLNDSGSGSLRDAVSQPNRIIVFDVSGVIRINSRMVFKNNLYVAGQTAPGEGITVYGDGVSFSGADNIIVRYMRFRMGAVGTKDKDAGGIANGQNMIFDHCSFSWGQDENFSINWDNKGTAPQNITLMNCIVGQGLMTHSAGGLMQADNISLYRILLVDNSTRNFKVKGTNQYVNNLVYNWKNAAYNMGGDSEGQSYANIESNLFINGPAVGGNCLTGGNANFHFYGTDNWQDSNRDGVYNPEEFTGDGGGDRQATPYDYPALEKWAANDLVEKLLPDVGASLPYRDLADCYMIDEVLSFGKKGNLITNENELPIGVPTSWSWFKGEKLADSDNDGMPDTWENAHGLKPNDASDAMEIAENGYANIENYINGITKADRQFFLRAPMLLELTEATTNSLTLTWADYSDNEEGFIVEMKQGDDFVEMGRTKGSAFTIENAGLQPATAYVVRVCAYQGETKSEYTAELTVKTRPEQVDIIDVETFKGDGDGEWLINPLDDEVVTLAEATPKKAVVVYSDAHVTINGDGYLSGSASLNKAGEGTLTIATDQQYEGATVLHQGVYEFSTLKNGGVASGLGMSQEFAQNWIMDGGVYKYTGATTSTNRSARLYNDTELNIANKDAKVTMSGSIEGQGNLIIDGEGCITVAKDNTSFFAFDGNLTMRGGSIVLEGEKASKAALGTASKLIMAGGEFITHSENDKNPKYTFPIETLAGTTSKISFYRNCEMANKVSGAGTLEWEVNWVREYLEGDWTGFTGTVIVNGTGTAGNSQFAMSKSDSWVGIPNGTLYLKGNAQVVGSKNQSTRQLGGLSGDKGTYLSGFDVKNAGSGTWVVGTANTNETFNGVIDNRSQSGKNGTTSIEKQGSGEWRLTGANVYSGTTYVTAGKLIVNGKHTGTGAITVRKGATLAGKGTLAAKTTVNVGGMLQIGDTLATDKGLTFSGGLQLNTGAILKLNDAMAEAVWQAGDEIQAFTGTVTGQFAEIQPATPGEGLMWDTTDLYTNGVLKVAVNTAISAVQADETASEYFTLKGERTMTPGKGLYLKRTMTADGRIVTKKVVR
ncbi:MAG: autotransporter-associated beta strand repeat-containing protein [Prevotella sp.]|nr:autotransporter-associated beta strand repeat-containing protein [Prevotella sp.]